MIGHKEWQKLRTLLDIARQVLGEAMTRRSGFALPLPPSVELRREEAAVVLEDLLRRGYLVERPLFPTETFWLEDGDPRASVLVITPLHSARSRQSRAPKRCPGDQMEGSCRKHCRCRLRPEHRHPILRQNQHRTENLPLSSRQFHSPVAQAWMSCNR